MTTKLFVQLDMKDAEVYYCKNFFEDSESIYEVLDKEIKWEKFPVRVMGKVFDSPRDNYYAADSDHPYKYSGFDRIPSPWTPVLNKIREIMCRVVKQINPKHPKINACLCNRYPDGDSYIGWHSDSESDLRPESFIISISLGATRDFVFQHKKTKEKITLPLKSGSIVLMGPGCQENWKHTVPKRKKVKDPRINLTYRSVYFCDVRS